MGPINPQEASHGWGKTPARKTRKPSPRKAHKAFPDAQYYVDTYGIDLQAASRCDSPDCRDFTLEKCAPLASDPELAKAGVSICANLSYRGGKAVNRLLFRRAGTKKYGEVSCTHVVVATLPAEVAIDARNIPMSDQGGGKPVDLPPEQHFAALWSYAAGIADVGIGNMLAAATEQGMGPEATGFNTFMQRQVVNAIRAVAPSLGNEMVAAIVRDLAKTTPVEWRNSRFNLLDSNLRISGLVAANPRRYGSLVEGAFPLHYREELQRRGEVYKWADLGALDGRNAADSEREALYNQVAAAGRCNKMFSQRAAEQGITPESNSQYHTLQSEYFEWCQSEVEIMLTDLGITRGNDADDYDDYDEDEDSEESTWNKANDCWDDALAIVKGLPEAKSKAAFHHDCVQDGLVNDELCTLMEEDLRAGSVEHGTTLLIPGIGATKEQQERWRKVAELSHCLSGMCADPRNKKYAAILKCPDAKKVGTSNPPKGSMGT